MALSLELKRALESDEPLTKRLKLAENAYCGMDLLINRKEETIYEWLCDLAPTTLVAWDSLNFCIHCLCSNNRTNILRKTKIKLIDTLINELQKIKENNPLEKILDSCECILSSLEMQQFFQTKINKLGLLLRHLFIRIKSENIKDSEEKRSAQSIAAYNCVLSGIDCLVKLQKLQIDKDKLAETFLDHVLGPLCALIDPNRDDSSNRIGAEAHKCMQQILFPKTRYAEYKNYFIDKEQGILPKKLFQTIAKQTRKNKSDDTFHVVAYVFRAVVGSYKTDGSLIDCFFRELINVSGNFKTEATNSLVKYLVDVPLEYENKVDDVSLKEVFENIIEETLTKKNFSDKEYTLLRNIATLNPLVIENKLSKILERILLEKREEESEKQSYVLLMISIMDASSKLRREHKLIPWILLALHKALEDNEKCNLSSTQILPPDFTSKFIGFASQLNASQVLAMLKSLTFHLKSNCVEEYTNGSRNHVFLMAECTVSLLTAFINGIVIFEHTVPPGMQQKFILALRQLEEVLSTLSEKIVKTKHNDRIMIILLEAVLSWHKIYSVVNYYVTNSEAEEISFPISEKNLKKLMLRAESSTELDCRNAFNVISFERISVNLNKQNPQKENLTGTIGRLEEYWSIILSDYPELIRILDSGQLSEFVSLILEDIVSNGPEKWQDILATDICSENERFVVAMLCLTLKKIGMVMGNSTSSAIAARIKLTKILPDLAMNTNIPVLGRKILIQDIIQLPHLSNDDSIKIEICLKTLLRIPVMSLNIPLRTMIFVMIYVVSKECEHIQGIKDLSEEILFETLEEGGVNVFNYIDPTSLMPSLSESKVIQKVFQMSLRNSNLSESWENLASSLISCPQEAAPSILSCIDNLRSKLNNGQRLVLDKVEEKLRKKVRGEIKDSKSPRKRIRSLIVALKQAIKCNRMKHGLKDDIKTTLESSFLDDDDDENEEKFSIDESKNLERKNKLTKEYFELAEIALQNRVRLQLSDELISNIWTKVFEYPEARVFALLVESSTLNVLRKVLITLHDLTEIQMQEADVTRLDSSIEIWNSIFTSDMGGAKTKFRLTVTLKLLQSLLLVDIHANHWPNLIKLLSATVKAKHMHLSGEYIDMVMLIAARSLKEGSSLTLCNEALTLCLNVVQSRTEIITDRLQIFLKVYREAVALITREAKQGSTTDRHQLALCTLNVEKVIGALVKLKRDMQRLSPYLLADLIKDLVEEDLPDVVKESFKNCFNNLSSICDSHGSTFLLRGLPADKRQTYKGLSEAYNKFHKFTGKI